METSSNPPQMAEPASAQHSRSLLTNPFFIGLEGLKRFFKQARGIAILLTIISIASALSNNDTSPSNSANTQLNDSIQSNPESIAMFVTVFIGILLLFIAIAFVIGSILKGVSDYTAVQTALGKKVALREAFSAVFKNFEGYVLLQLLIVVKIFLWSLLLIVPGVIKAIQYSLAGVTYFAEGKKGNAAINRSKELTRNRLMTTFASHVLFNLPTLGLVQLPTEGGVNSILYSQYRTIESSKEQFNTHWLSKATVIVLIILAAIAIIGLAVVLSVLSTRPLAP